ncbi:MAG: ribosome-associated translation inhibitor RaiA [Atopobiaceae bacterium]|jgi:putative sigma-54 modulation protein|nr:ribosome-associated translation inhibitor RaiA [Atopobiaceae bacterium]
MVSIKISGRKVTISDALREQVDLKIGNALKVFDIKPMTCDVVLRADKNHSYGKRNACEVTVYVRDNVVRVEATGEDLEAAIDEAASKVTRQLRKYKTRVVDKRQRSKRPEPVVEPVELPEPEESAEEDDALVREKVVELKPMTVDEALIQIDLIGHDFYVFEDSRSGLTNVVYRRKDGGYGIIRPKIEDEDEQA